MGPRNTIVASALAGLLVVVGCANGGATDDSIAAFGDDAAGAQDATHGGTNQDSGGGGSFDAGAGGSDAGGSVADGGDAGMGDDGGSGVVSCPAPNTCAAATNLGTIPGDASGSKLTQSGYTSEWLVIDVQETDSSVTAVPMKLTATLTSPPGSNYDLYAYLGSSPSMVECSTVEQSSTNGAGQDDTVSFEWGETGTFANGTDDSRMVTLEIRYVSGPCTTSANWSLSAHGH